MNNVSHGKITYEQQYRKCGKPNCKTCREGRGHGPYWYAYYRDHTKGRKVQSVYIGKIRKGVEMPA